MANVPEKRLVDLRPDLPRHQSVDAAPVVFNHELPTMAPMAKVKAEPKKTGQILMDAKAPLRGGGKDRMAPVPKSTTSKPPARRKAQEARPAHAPVAADGYVRLEMHAEDGRLSVVGVHEVAGPLTIPDAMILGHVYEVLDGDRRIGLGSIPDVGMRHAFANADVPGAEGKHRFIQEPSFNFFVRVPKAELTTQALPRMHIVLHLIAATPDRVSAQPLAKHPGVNAVEIARLPGIKLEELQQQVRPQLERMLHENAQKR